MKRIFTLFIPVFFISWLSNAQPSTQASGIVISPVSGSTTSMRFDWTNGNGANRIIIFKTSASTYAPTNLVTAPTSVASSLVSPFPANAAGSDLDGTAEIAACIFNSVVDGTGTTVTVTGLTVNKEYTIQIYEYSGSSTTTTYSFSTASGNPVTLRYITANGTNWNVPSASIKGANVQVWGAGGGGGSAGNANNFGGGGGGGGAYSSKLVTSLSTASNPYTVSIGAGGSGGAAGANTAATDGGDSFFNTAGTVMAKGGVKGLNNVNGSGGGVGGAFGSGVGTVRKSGGTGGNGGTASGGGGGSSAGSNSDGSGLDGLVGGNGTSGSGAAGGSGGTSVIGGAAGGKGQDQGTATLAVVGGFPGGGGGASSDNNSYAGAVGASGLVIISYTLPTARIVRQTPVSSLTNASSVTFRVTFSENVSNVTATGSDFSLSGTASSGASISTVNTITASTVYDVVVTGVSGTGNLNLDFAGGQDIVSSTTGNLLTGTSITYEEEYTVDTNAPVISSVTSNATGAGVLKIGDQIIFTADIATTEAGLIIAPTTYNGGTLTWSTANSGDTYTATYTVASGHTDQPTALQLTNVTATDAAGNASGAVSGTDVVKTIDGHAPVISSVTSNATGAGVLKIGDQIIFTVDIATTEAGLTIAPTTYNGGTLTWSTANGGDTYTATYTVVSGHTDRPTAFQLTNVTATDAAGNTSGAVSGTDVVKTIDAHAPVISSVTSNATGAGVLKIGDQIIFTVDIATTEAGLIIVPTTYNGGTLTWSTANGGDTYTATYTVASGHTDQSTALQLASVTATDAAGNSGNTVSGTDIVKTIDAHAPVISSVTSNATGAGVLKIGDQIIFTVDIATTEAGLTIAPTTYNGGTLTWSTANSGDTYTATYTVASGHTDRPTAFQLASVTATDATGNTSSAVSGTDIVKTIDAHAPVISSVTSNATGAGVLKIGDQIIFTVDIATTEAGLTIAPTTYNGGTLTWSTANSGDTYTATYTVISGHTDQPTALQLTSVTATDAAGNASGAVSGTDVVKTIDAHAPVISSVTSNATGAGVLKIGDQIIFTVDIATTEAGLTIAPTTYNGGTLTWSTSNGGDTYTATYTVVSGHTDQPTALQLTNVTATDAAGNPSAAVSGTDIVKTIDAHAPTLVISAPSATIARNASSITFTITYTGASTINLTNGDITVNSSGGANASANVTNGATSTPTVTLTNFTGNGSVTISIAASTASDVAGNTAGTAGPSASITVDNIAPTAPSIPDLTAATDSYGGAGNGTNADNITNSITPTFVNPTATLENGSIVTLTSDLGPTASGSVSSGNYSINMGAITEGTHSITAYATDAAGNVSTISSGLSVKIDRTPPTRTGVSFTDNGPNGNREIVVITFSETIDLINNDVPSGYASSTNSVRSSGATLYNTAANTITLESNSNGGWTQAGTTWTYTNSGSTSPSATNYTKDVAGNELLTGTFNSTDTSPPVLITGMIFNPNGTSPETITFDLDETLSLANGAAVTGFVINPGAIAASGIYSGKGTTNTITLTSGAEGQWTDAVTVSYSQASGNVTDASAATNELAAITNESILLRLVNISSNNSTNTAFATTGNTVSITFTSSRTLTATPTATIGGIAATVTGSNPYTATVTTTASLPASESIIAFSLTGLETGKSTTISTTTIPAYPSTASSVTFDKTNPTFTAASIISNNSTNTAYAKPSDNVTLTFTVSEPLSALPTATIDGKTATVTNTGGLNYNAVVTTDNTYNTGTLAFTISIKDQAGLTGSRTTTTNASSVTFDKTAPTVVLSDSETDNLVRDVDNITITATFTETNTPLGTPKITIGTFVTSQNMTATGNPLVWTYVWNVPSGSASDGTAAVSVSSNDPAGNANTAATGRTSWLIDNTAPTVVLSDSESDHIVRDVDNVLITATFTELNNLSGIPKISIGSIVSNVNMTATANPLVWTYLWDVPAGNDGSAAVSVSVTDVAGNANAAATGVTSWTIDNTSPAISPVSITSNNSTNTAYATTGNTITLTFTVNEPLTGTPTVTINGSSVTPTNVGLSYTAVITTTASFPETVIPFTISLTDVAGNTNSTAATTNASSVTFDKTVPTSTLIAISSPTVTWNSIDVNGTSLSTLTWALTFSENITGLNASDISVTPKSATNITYSALLDSDITGSGQNWTVTVRNVALTAITTDAFIRIDLRDDDTIIDVAGNPLGGSGTGGAVTTTYTGDFYYTVRFPEPAEAAQGFSVTNQTTTSFDINWSSPTSPTRLINYYLIDIAKHSVASFNTLTDGVYGTTIPDYDISDGAVTILSPGLPAGNFSFNVESDYGITLESGVAYDIRITSAAYSGKVITGATQYQFDYLTATTLNGTGTTTIAPLTTVSLVSAVSSFSSHTTKLSGAVAPQQDAVQNFQFSITDDGASPGSDNAPFKFSKIVITEGTSTTSPISNWTQAIAFAELSDGVNPAVSVTTAAVTTSPNTITFNVNPATVGFITQNTTKTYTLRIALATALGGTLPLNIDGKNFEFRVDGTSFTYDNAINNQASSTLLTGSNAESGDSKNKVSVDAFKLVFNTPGASPTVTNPQSSIGVGTRFSFSAAQQPIVYALDANNNHDTGFTQTATIDTPLPGPNLSPSFTSLAFSGGVLNLTNLALNAQGVNGNIRVQAPTILLANAAISSNVTTVISSKTVISDATLPSAEQASFPSITNSLPAAFNFDFTVTDDVGADPTNFTDNDALPTLIQNITITQGANNGDNDTGSGSTDATTFDQWTYSIAGAELKAIGSTQTVAATINNSSLVFNTAGTFLETVPNGGSLTYQLRIWLKDGVTMNASLHDILDNKDFSFAINQSNISTAGAAANSTSALATSSASTADGTNMVTVDATQLDFTTEPASSQNYDASIIPSAVDPAFPTSPVIVKARDANKNTDIDHNYTTYPVTLSTTPVSGRTFPLQSVGAASTTNGIYAFAGGMNVSSSGNGINGDVTHLTVSGNGPSGALTAGNSSNFTLNYSSSSSVLLNHTTYPFTHPTDILYASSSNQIASITSTSDGTAMEQFVIKDGPDADGSSTVVKSLTLRITNSQYIRSIALFKGNSTTPFAVAPGTAIVGGDITFNLTTSPTPDFFAGDELTETLTIYTTFNATGVTDNDQISFELLNITPGAVSSGFSTTTPALTGTITAAQNKIEVVATQLDFITPNTNTTASLNSNFAVVVHARDANTNLDLDFISAITNVTNATNATMEGNAITIGTAGSGITFNTTPFSGGVFSFPSTFQFVSGNNNDDVTLAVFAGGIRSVPVSPGPAPFTPVITLKSSFESVLIVDPGFSPTFDLPYKDYQDISTSATSIALAQFKLFDGDGTNPDSDGASTNIKDITFSITNPSNIRGLGIYLGNTLIQSKDNSTFITAAGVTTVTFTNLSSWLIAPDASPMSIVFTVRASFYNTAPNVHDNDVIQLHVESASQNGGSQFNNVVSNPIGGFTGGALTDGGVKIEVTATKLDFTTQPGIYAGINEPVGTDPSTGNPYVSTPLPSTTAGIVTARDINQLVDLDFNYPSTSIAITDNAGDNISSPSDFINGVLKLDGLKYSTAGDGTLTVNANGINSSTAPAISSTLVNVVNVTATAATNGVLNTTNIKGGSVNAVIFGVTFTPDNNYQTTSEPSLSKFIFTFDKPYESSPGGVTKQIFKNFNVTESSAASYAGSSTVTLSGATISKGATASTAALGAGYYDQVIVDWGLNPPRKLFNPLTGNAVPLSYFLVADVDATASISTPSLTPQLIDGGYGSPNDTDIITTNGTALALGGAVVGNTYQFASTRPPVLKAALSNPYSGQLNVDPGITYIDLAFDVPVLSLDGVAELFKRSTNTKVANLVAVPSGNYINSHDLASTVNPIRFNINFLSGLSFQPDEVYYVTIKKGSFDNITLVGTGISDSGLNFYGGITSNGTYYFKISSLNPPKLTSALGSFSNTSIGSFKTIFDQTGTAYYLVLKSGSTAPTTDQILDPSTYSPAINLITGNSYVISQVNTAQTVTFSAPLALSTTYDVWIFAQNDAQPTPQPLASVGLPYGATPFNIGGTGPTFKLSIPSSVSNSNQPVYSLCPDSYVDLSAPIVIGESTDSEFYSSSLQDFYILLPTGFQFDGTHLPSVQLNGGDFDQSSLVIARINNTLVHVSYVNNNTLTRDNIVISDLKIIGATGSNPGSITRFAGTNKLGLTSPTLASISLFPTSIQKFINSYANDNTFPNPLLTNSLNVTAIPDDYIDIDPLIPGAVRLLPSITPSNDYNASFFSGIGITDDKLSLSAVALNSAFDITMSHTDPNGCISNNSVQYLVYDHKSPVSSKLGASYLPPSLLAGTQQAIVNTNFPSAASSASFPVSPSPGPTSSIRINTDDLAGYKLLQLDANLPASEILLNAQGRSSQIITGTTWQTVVSQIPVEVNRVLTTNVPVTPPPSTSWYYRDYQWDYSQILNATSAGISKNPYDNFKNTTAIGNTYWQGGSLGKIEFTGTFQSQADFTVLVPFRQNVELFVPAVPIIEIGSSNQSSTDATDATTNNLDSTIPSQHVNTFQYTNPNGYQGTPIFCESGGLITLNGFPSALSGTSQGKFAIYDYKTFDFNSSTNPVLLAPVSGSSFVDNGNGTATIDPSNAQLKNGYNDLLVTYTYQENNSPAAATGYLVMRISPNPIAAFTPLSIIGINTPVSTAYCENREITFDPSTSSITNGTIASYQWNFGDATNSTGTNPNSSTSQIGSHIYTQTAAYAPSLIVTSSFGCASPVKSNPLNVGVIPTVDFGFTGVSTADDIAFINKTVINAGAVNDGLKTLDWDFGDGNTSNVTSGFNTAVTNQYTKPNPYSVTLKVTSQKGCVNSLQQPIVVLPQSTPVDANAYNETFEASSGDWQVWNTGTSTTAISWAYGTPTTSVIVPDPAINGSKIWKTNLSGNYNGNERSALYSPSFDLSKLLRPMISFSSFVQMEQSDGVVLQYSTDNKNITDVTKVWNTLGDLGEGVDWFTTQGIAAKPGDQSSKDLGWSNSDQITWLTSKHSLAPVQAATQVVFRFALASVKPNVTFEGFAIDNVRLGERTRTVLFESFANTSNTDAQEKAQNETINQFSTNAVGTEVVKINYHVAFPGLDPFNTDNGADPSARALYYNVTSTPRTRIDGEKDDQDRLFSDWGSNLFEKRSLQLSQATLGIDPIVKPDGTLSISIDVNAVVDLPENTILQVAVLEESVASSLFGTGVIKSGETNFEYVLKKMLPSAAGTRFGTVLAGGQTKPFGPFEWTPDAKKLYAPSNDLAVIVFLQNETTKEIYQSEIAKDLSDPPVITGLGDISGADIAIYPNPADRQFTIQLPGAIQNEVSIQLMDQLGQFVRTTNFAQGEQKKTISTESLAEGLYIIQMGEGDTAIRKKVIITHK
jgi:hypothetical protein